jgi:hypothetical protein
LGPANKNKRVSSTSVISVQRGRGTEERIFSILPQSLGGKTAPKAIPFTVIFGVSATTRDLVSAVRPRLLEESISIKNVDAQNSKKTQGYPIKYDR